MPGSSPGRTGVLRIGIYGGTFNPIHIAHLLAAEEIRERLRLDRVLFIPSGSPPHKQGEFPSGAERLRMVRTAVEGNDRFGTLDLEVRRRGPSYTVETLRELRSSFPRGTELYFLVGMDAFREIGTWHEPDSLADLAHLVVFPRGGVPLEAPLPFAPGSWKADGDPKQYRGATRLPLKGKKSIYLVETTALFISATDIRERLRRGRSIRYLVPEAVRSHIFSRGLYPRKIKGG